MFDSPLKDCQTFSIMQVSQGGFANEANRSQPMTPLSTQIQAMLMPLTAAHGMATPRGKLQMRPSQDFSP